MWQSICGQQLGSIWGHGALVAPDWSADWLHREATAWLDVRARAKDVLIAWFMFRLWVAPRPEVMPVGEVAAGRA